MIEYPYVFGPDPDGGFHTRDADVKDVAAVNEIVAIAATFLTIMVVIIAFLHTYTPIFIMELR
jgi:hypothetical protein